jgi:glycosyltransferase involved in cell wall biosynthesis
VDVTGSGSPPRAVADRAASLTRVVALLSARGPVNPDAVLAAWHAAHDEPATRPAARTAAPALVRALRRRAWQLSAPPAAPQLRRTATVLADQVRRECEVPALRAELRLEGLLARLDAGDALSAAEVHEQVTPALAVADAFLPGAGLPGTENPLEDVTAAARLLTGVLSALLHRTLHNDDLDSPLAFGPEAYLAPLRRSTAYGLLTGAKAGEGSAPATRGQRPARRVLLVHGENRNFLADLIAPIETSGAELRVLDVTAPPEGLRVPGVQQLFAERLALAADRSDAVATTGPSPGSPAAELLAWPDLVVVDWAMDAAAWASMHVPETARLVVRLHRIEAFSVQAHAIDYGRVDDLIIASEPIVAFARQALPLLPEQRVHVVPVVPEFDRYPTAKRESAGRTLALVGWNVPVKDVGWALDVVEGLRAHDPRWRLLLVGSGLGDKLTARSWIYKAETERRIAAAEAAGAVQRLGFRDDLPELLRDVGVILTSSKIESYHVGFFEGAASGAFPVARDWPWVRAYAGGARSVMPAEWVVDDPAAAVERVLAADAAGELAARGLEAAACVRERYGDTHARLGEALGLA